MLYNEDRNVGEFMKKTMKDYLDAMTFDVILDVREQGEYDLGHVEGAKLVPLSTVSTYQGNKDDAIAVYCRSGNRSEIARQTLVNQGYTNVTNIGGVMDQSVQLTNK